MNKEKARDILKLTRNKIQNIDAQSNKQDEFLQTIETVIKDFEKKEIIQALDIAIESLEHQVNEKDEIKLVCPKCKREWTKPIGEFCSSCGTEMVVEPYERKE